jgi:hypothetical protein
MGLKQVNRGFIWKLACLAVFLSSSAFAATITVTNANDGGPGSLRDAIASAASGDTIDFNLAYPATITLGSTLTISTNLTISGPGAANLAISGGGTVRVFSVGSCTTVGSVPCSTVTATVSGLTIENGSGSYGGGAFYNVGTLNISNSTLTGNSANTANGGGAIYNYLGVVSMTNCTLTDNAVANIVFGNGGSGGGILNANGVLTLNNSTISGNSASGYCSDGSPCSFGGGISNSGGTADVVNSTIAANSATYGGGIESSGDSTFPAVLTVSSTTVFGNSAVYGGGINAGDGTFAIKNTIVANTPSGGNCSGGFTSYGYNLSDDATCAFGAPGDMNSTPAGLDPGGLQNNGASTQTIALRTISPAVDAIPLNPTNRCTLPDGVTPITTDQRGVARPQGFACDIGAYELLPNSVSSFSSLTAKLDFKGRGFALNAAFTLSADSWPINPFTQPVQLQIGPYAVTIPAGSFHQATGSGNWTYTGTISGVKLNAQVSGLGGANYQFNVTGSPVNFTGVSNPVTVAIGIGLDAGSTMVTATF